MPRCSHNHDGKCMVPFIGGEATEEKCGECFHYTGPVRGLGDRVAAVTKATGVHAAMQRIAGGCGGCARRMAALNKAFPAADTEDRST